MNRFDSAKEWNGLLAQIHKTRAGVKERKKKTDGREGKFGGRIRRDFFVSWMILLFIGDFIGLLVISLVNCWDPLAEAAARTVRRLRRADRESDRCRLAGFTRNFDSLS
jgi:hypothetical protein